MGHGLVIRAATPGDIAAMGRMARDFARAAAVLPFDAAYADASLRGHIGQPDRLSLVLELGAQVRGMLCAGATQSPLAPVRIAQELVFWIDPPARGRWASGLIRAYEAWARVRGCQIVSLVTLPAQPADVLYRRCGFSAVEHIFAKAL
jgi:GNAT superfamily N-acetyltransferase